MAKQSPANSQSAATGSRLQGAGRSLASAPALQGHVHEGEPSANFLAVDAPELVEKL